MVARGNLGPYANTTEAAQIRLARPLVTGKSYELSIDLAYSDTHGHYADWDFLSYANPVVLKVWGAADSCATTELLWQSPAVDHLDWRTYDLTLTPQRGEARYLVLEVDYAALPAYFGNILIDNLVEKDLPEPPANRCNLEAFNVFTPNGDGHNDQFLFRPVSNVARFTFKVCNRWGAVLFETTSLAEGWDGTHHGAACPAGVYFWYTEFTCIEDNQLFDNKMKGYVTLIR
ncbi:MAG: gliding motility-associated C-terminal domain-containing protein [Cytophagales bacterium]|nr:gliding motility-associated C-terminal domain-containing protein [Cytophagales bacterium]